MRITGRFVRGTLVAGSLALVGYALLNGAAHGWTSGDVLNPLLVGVLVLAEFGVTRAGATAQARPAHHGTPRRGRTPVLAGRPRRTTCRPAGRRDSGRNR